MSCLHVPRDMCWGALPLAGVFICCFPAAALPHQSCASQLARALMCDSTWTLEPSVAFLHRCCWAHGKSHSRSTVHARNCQCAGQCAVVTQRGTGVGHRAVLTCSGGMCSVCAVRPGLPAPPTLSSLHPSQCVLQARRRPAPGGRPWSLYRAGRGQRPRLRGVRAAHPGHRGQASETDGLRAGPRSRQGQPGHGRPHSAAEVAEAGRPRCGLTQPSGSR